MNIEESEQNKQPPPPKQLNFWKVFSIVLGILFLGLVGVYARSNFETIRQWFAPASPINDIGKCPNGSPNYCTADLREMCSPDNKEKKTVPSDCSCGEDAVALIAKGWKDCAEITPDAREFRGTVKTGAQLGEVKSYCPEGLYLVADKGTYLFEQTTILQLRVSNTSGDKLLSDQKYINKKVRVVGKYPAQQFFCEALICGCDDYILVGQIEIVELTPTTPLLISGISPSSAPSRTEVTIVGSGFTPIGNTIHFGTEAIPDVTSADGKTLVFTVPSGCRGGSPCAPGTYTTVPPGNYKIYIVNERGASDKAVFTVVETAEITPDAREFRGTVKTGAQLGEVKSYCPEGLYLVADEGTYLVEQTTILQLRLPSELGNKLFSDLKYIGKKVRVIGQHPARQFVCEAMICGCDDYILVERINIIDAGSVY